MGFNSSIIHIRGVSLYSKLVLLSDNYTRIVIRIFNKTSLNCAISALHIVPKLRFDHVEYIS
jgi:hypothetical protein